MKIRKWLDEAEQFYFRTEALNQILVAADCPEDVRSLIDYLIGFSQGKEEFKAYDMQLSIYVQTGKRKDKESAANQWVSHTRKKLNDWQDKSGAGFVIHNEGDFDKNINKRPQATYQLPILALIENVMIKAQENAKLWNQDTALAIKLAAQDLVKKHIDDPLNTILRVPYVKPPHAAAKQNITTATTYIEKARAEIRKLGFKYLSDPEGKLENLMDSAKALEYEINEANKEAGFDS